MEEGRERWDSLPLEDFVYVRQVHLNTVLALLPA
jgi:hypothetical protein